MTAILTIDFETRSADDLKSAGVHHYAADPSTDVLCLALKPRGEEPVAWLPDERLTPEVRFAAAAGGLPLVGTEAMLAMVGAADVIEAHNAGFELEIWRRLMSARRGFPPLPPRKLRCTAARAVVAGFPRPLDQAGAILLADEWKDDQGTRLMRKMCRPRKPRRGEDPAGVYWHEDPADLVRLAEYCRQDTRAQEALSRALPELPASELALFQFDLAVNGRGIAVDLAAVDAISAAVEEAAGHLTAEFQDLTGLDSPTQRDATLGLLQEMGVPISGLTARDVDEALGDEDAGLLGGAAPGVDPRAARVLEIRRSLSRSSLAKYQAMRRAACPDGRLRGLFMYYGAATGRWAGRLVQPQNFPRGAFADVDGCIALFLAGDAGAVEMLYGDLFVAASSCLRGMIVPAPGHDFIAADYSAIEGRVLAWLAGEESALDVYRAGRDPYKVAAAAIHRVAYDDVSRDQRQIGKVAELACGYQGAVGAFQAMGSSFGLELPEDEVRGIVRGWRESRPKTVGWWHELENCAVAALERPGDEFRAGPVSLSCMDGALLIRLPSGRCLYYRNPRLEEKDVPWGRKMCIAHDGVDSYSRRWKTQYLYGGRIAENVTQAVARDILCRGMLRAEAAGYPIVMHVHDEAVAEVPEGFGSVEVFEELLCAPIPWARGLPLKAEGWRGKRYRK
ncbi:MAG: DNA polymerase [Lentisphaeria bacterium]|jgi:DNA polymerase